MLCEGCSEDHHERCGMQTWCTCDCAGPDGLYVDPDPWPWSPEETGMAEEDC